ncbi:GNAT family N-acetyltransferase [Altericroceibacterium endophyticum]|uniref:GNAT family N-acetyltransferase n=1 Tax=Altericroceibacterium endophyticum TaxID=1808508 RepID=A0A6I4T2Q0_9SPHN|nr:GNAT family N-acetyltransferase [Altericroceibacterium endophyticum]MXO64501.1 GNAT family N-acetyltransferase [Altericroceibacterium endophyticum]
MADRKPGWRAMTRHDLPQVFTLADAIHEDYPERPEVFAEKLTLYPQGCFVLASGEKCEGYFISHPWQRARPPALDTLLGALPAQADLFYIHDLAISMAARGAGAASRILKRSEEHALSQQLTLCGLVAVGNSAPFWKAQGFEPQETPALRAKLATYGDMAVYMEKPL